MVVLILALAKGVENQKYSLGNGPRSLVGHPVEPSTLHTGPLADSFVEGSLEALGR